jgi:hypothetical protein
MNFPLLSIGAASTGNDAAASLSIVAAGGQGGDESLMLSRAQPLLKPIENLPQVARPPSQPAKKS